MLVKGGPDPIPLMADEESYDLMKVAKTSPSNEALVIWSVLPSSDDELCHKAMGQECHKVVVYKVIV